LFDGEGDVKALSKVLSRRSRDEQESGSTLALHRSRQHRNHPAGTGPPFNLSIWTLQHQPW